MIRYFDPIVWITIIFFSTLTSVLAQEEENGESGGLTDTLENIGKGFSDTSKIINQGETSSRLGAVSKALRGPVAGQTLRNEGFTGLARDQIEIRAKAGVYPKVLNYVSKTARIAARAPGKLKLFAPVASILITDELVNGAVLQPYDNISKVALTKAFYNREKNLKTDDLNFHAEESSNRIVGPQLALERVPQFSNRGHSAFNDPPNKIPKNTPKTKVFDESCEETNDHWDFLEEPVKAEACRLWYLNIEGCEAGPDGSVPIPWSIVEGFKSDGAIEVWKKSTATNNRYLAIFDLSAEECATNLVEESWSEEPLWPWHEGIKMNLSASQQ